MPSVIAFDHVRFEEEMVKQSPEKCYNKSHIHGSCHVSEPLNKASVAKEVPIMLQFGIPVLVENDTLRENVDLCKELGFNFIELNTNFPEYGLEALEDSEPLLKAAEQAHIYYTIHLDENMDIADFNPLVRSAYLESVRRIIEAAKKLTPLIDSYGDPSQPLTLNMHMNHGIHMTLPDRIVQMYERNFDNYMQSFRTFRDRCEEWIGDSNIVVSVENTTGYLEFEKKAIELLIESPRFGLTWDIGHSRANGGGDIPFILSHQEKLRHFHIHDGSAQPPRDHQPLGTGDIDLPGVLSLAQKVNAHCLIEVKTTDALRQSQKWLRQRDYL
jgi:sugar phosphate isomerase/epimerase